MPASGFLPVARNFLLRAGAWSLAHKTLFVINNNFLSNSSLSFVPLPLGVTYAAAPYKSLIQIYIVYLNYLCLDTNITCSFMDTLPKARCQSVRGQLWLVCHRCGTVWQSVEVLHSLSRVWYTMAKCSLRCGTVWPL